MPKITVEKGTDREKTQPYSEHSDKVLNMEEGTKVLILKMIETKNVNFHPEHMFNELYDYLRLYERILYAPISSLIYKYYDNNYDLDGTLLTNLDDLVHFTEDPDKIQEEIANKKYDKNQVKRARKVTLKLRDHVTLACHQYTMLKQTDAEYDEKFQQRIDRYKEEMTKEMNAQMITMVSIFTALAFLVFGSVTSLDGIFENIEMPIFKVMSIALIWGICVFNMIFMFLHCISKMTKLNFKSNTKTEASIWKQYPIVWWSNFLMISLLMLTLWGNFVQHNVIGEWLLELVNDDPRCIFLIGVVVIVGIIVLAFRQLYRLTILEDNK